MVAVHLSTIIGADRKLVIQLPEDIPPGEVELIVRSTEQSGELGEGQSAREAARAKLLAAGALVTQFRVPTDTARLSVEERMRIGTLPPGARSSLDHINDDRGEW